MFQDVITQTLMRSPHSLVYSGGKRAVERTRILARELMARHGVWSARLGQIQPSASLTASQIPGDSLLAVKGMLIAVRLCHQPPALILDEPDWGLSRSTAVALVASVVEKAHRLDIPVWIISHKPWWQSIAATVLEVQKTISADSDHRFVIHLCRQDKKK
jgi:ABC-type branched-subunit amino acid transport system ATPase component